MVGTQEITISVEYDTLDMADCRFLTRRAAPGKAEGKGGEILKGSMMGDLAHLNMTQASCRRYGGFAQERVADQPPQTKR